MATDHLVRLFALAREDGPAGQGVLADDAVLVHAPVMHSVTVEPDADRLSIAWRGSGLALRPYQDQERETMPSIVQW